MGDGDTNGTPITRRELALELRAARSDDRNETVKAINEAVKPVVEHINHVNSGEFTPGMRAGISSVFEEQKRDSWLLRSNKAAVFGVCIVLSGILANTALVLLLNN